MMPRDPVPTAGLSATEAARRLGADGYSELPRPDRRPFLRILLGILAEPMFGLLVLFMAALNGGMPADQARALAFVALMLINFGLVLVNRSFAASPLTALLRPNTALWTVLGVMAAVMAATLAWPPAADLFAFGPLHADDLAVAFVAAIVMVLALEMVKPLWADHLRR
ncbi:cation transport ATPase-like protein [Nitrospirillum amazonense]|uniref:Cation transport ATPase-like protein n=2 Tax=Nitrospirillum amazonense TaxID=28077 RepID=A0A560FK51_9PROT|nr:cation transport ATPase-like protein [Nitrospirillum amazonense]